MGALSVEMCLYLKGMVKTKLVVCCVSSARQGDASVGYLPAAGGHNQEHDHSIASRHRAAEPSPAHAALETVDGGCQCTHTH